MDIEEVIPALIALFGALGFIGFLGNFFPVINEIPYVFSGPHHIFTLLGSFIDQYVAFGSEMWAVILELAITIIFALISYHVGM